MSEDTNKTKTLSLSGSGKLSLGGVDSAPRRGAELSARRGKTVQVEVRRKRVPASQIQRAQSVVPQASPPPTPVASEAEFNNEPEIQLQDGLTATERANRIAVLKQGIKRSEGIITERQIDKSYEGKENYPSLDGKKVIQKESEKTEDVSSLRRRAELAELEEIEAQTKARREEQLSKIEADQIRRKNSNSLPIDVANDMTQSRRANEASVGRRKREEDIDMPRRTPGRNRGSVSRRQGKLTISEALSGTEGGRQRSLASVRRQREKARMREEAHPQIKQVRDVTIPDSITVSELANRMAERSADVVKELMKQGIMVTATQSIDAETAELVTIEFGHKALRVSESDIEIGLQGEEDSKDNLKTRPPVITIMGHVDHGKTSLLDAIRKTDVAGSESGGITQHIGSYQIKTQAGNTITFIDTPGHEAFTEMRLRGASTTDIVVLVVAADDSVKEQTIEAIDHAKAAECPIIVAVNKCDKPEADPQRVRSDLLQYEIITEDFGGEVQCIDVSALTGQGLYKLEEAMMLQAEILELKANPDRAAEGSVIEAKVERGRGSVATVLVQKGTLKVGDIFVVGAEYGKVRALLNDRGSNIEKAYPGQPVEVLGLNGTPMSGDQFIVVPTEARAREIADYRSRQARDKEAVIKARGSVEQMLSAIAAGEAEELPVVIKTDVHGSLEAIKVALDKLASEQVKVRILTGGVGALSESDISLAAASQAIVVGFNVRAIPQARDLARRDGVEIRYHSIIYELIEEIKSAMGGLLSPEKLEEFIGYAEIREVFSVSKLGKVAGCYVTEGIIRRGCSVRLLRENVVIHEGSLKTLKRFKDEVKEVKDGLECGMAFENYSDIQQGDMIECFELKEIARTL